MSLFNLFKKQDQKTNALAKIDFDYKNCIEIAKIISRNDQNVINEISECITNPDLYFSNHKSKYEGRFIMDSNNLDTVIWIGLVDCLIKNKYACERDYKDEIEDFIYFMNDMNYEVKFDKDLLNADGYIAEWCEELDKELKTKNLCIGGIDIDSDSYVMFICENNKLEKLSEYAQNINHRITSASKL